MKGGHVILRPRRGTSLARSGGLGRAPWRGRPRAQRAPLAIFRCFPRPAEGAPPAQLSPRWPPPATFPPRQRPPAAPPDPLDARGPLASIGPGPRRRPPWPATRRRWLPQACDGLSPLACNAFFPRPAPANGAGHPGPSTLSSHQRAGRAPAIPPSPFHGDVHPSARSQLLCQEWSPFFAYVRGWPHGGAAATAVARQPRISWHIRGRQTQKFRGSFPTSSLLPRAVTPTSLRTPRASSSSDDVQISAAPSRCVSSFIIDAVLRVFDSPPLLFKEAGLARSPLSAPTNFPAL